MTRTVRSAFSRRMRSAACQHLPVTLELSERWWGLDDTSEPAEAKRAAVLRELNAEASADHALTGRIAEVTAFFEASDDVVVRLIDGAFALVHPTWSGRTETPPFPLTRLLGDGPAASRAIATWEESW